MNMLLENVITFGTTSGSGSGAKANCIVTSVRWSGQWTSLLLQCLIILGEDQVMQ